MIQKFSSGSQSSNSTVKILTPVLGECQGWVWFKINFISVYEFCGVITNFSLQLHETYCSICRKRQVSQVSQEDCLSLCNLLETRGIISMKRAKETRMAKVRMLPA